MSFIFMTGLFLMTSCGGENITTTTTEEEKKEGLLHYIHDESYENRYIGDVHPYYNKNTDEWYMYYLDTSGQFNSKLLVSKDGISWKPKDINLTSFMANYAVLGIVESEGKYFSYYGDYWASVSTDLINWEYAGEEYKIPQDKKQFPGGNRDPYVAYDETTDRYYSVSINYPRRIPSEGIYQANLAIGKSEENTLTSFSNSHKKVFANDSMNNDPECPQLIKIGNRWYVFYSVYGKSAHGVGRTEYLIGDENKDPYSVDWQSKAVNYLSGEDLCAAQVAEGKDGKLYMFGWIPKQYSGSFWGGHLNLPTEVYQVSDGSLRTRFSEEAYQSVKGDKINSLNEGNLTTSQKMSFNLTKRNVVELNFDLSKGDIKLSNSEKKVDIIVEKLNDRYRLVIKSQYQTTAYIDIKNEDVSKNNQLKIIFEEDMLEVSFNNKYVLQSRVAFKFGNDVFDVSAYSGNVKLDSLEVYKLNFLEELK